MENKDFIRENMANFAKAQSHTANDRRVRSVSVAFDGSAEIESAYVLPGGKYAKIEKVKVSSL